MGRFEKTVRTTGVGATIVHLQLTTCSFTQKASENYENVTHVLYTFSEALELM